jgi:hypothetical protein
MGRDASRSLAGWVLGSRRVSDHRGVRPAASRHGRPWRDAAATTARLSHHTLTAGNPIRRRETGSRSECRRRRGAARQSWPVILPMSSTVRCRFTIRPRTRHSVSIDQDNAQSRFTWLSLSRHHLFQCCRYLDYFNDYCKCLQVKTMSFAFTTSCLRPFVPPERVAADVAGEVWG